MDRLRFSNGNYPYVTFCKECNTNVYYHDDDIIEYRGIVSKSFKVLCPKCGNQIEIYSFHPQNYGK